MIRIVHVISGLGLGGAEQALARLVQAADRSRFASEVISLQGPGVHGPELAALGIPVQCLGMDRQAGFACALPRLAIRLRRSRPDVVQTWMYHANVLGSAALRLAGRSGVRPNRRWPALIWGIRQSSLEPGRLKWSAAALARLGGVLSGALPDRIVYNAEAGRSAHEAAGYRRERGLVIPNGFDTEALREDAEGALSLRRAWGVSAEAPVIGMVARFDPMKDFGTFLRGAARLAAKHPDARFVLAGPGVDEANCELARLIDGAGVRDRIVLAGPRRDVVAVLSTFDVATSSSAWSEGFSNVLGEAMACGRACVVTDVGDAAAIVGDAGRAVPAGDDEALARAWAELLEGGRAAREALGREARERVRERYSQDAMARRFEALWEEHAGRGGGRAMLAGSGPADAGLERS